MGQPNELNSSQTKNWLSLLKTLNTGRNSRISLAFGVLSRDRYPFLLIRFHFFDRRLDGVFADILWPTDPLTLLRRHFNGATWAFGGAQPAALAVIVVEFEPVAGTELDHRVVGADAVAVVAFEAIAA